MTTKAKVLELLEKNTNIFISGQEIADKLFLTRASVWKAIKVLQKDGHDIEAITNKGYRLLKTTSGVDNNRIIQELVNITKRDKTEKDPFGYSPEKLDILTFEEVASTNDVAIEYGKTNYVNHDSDLVIVADTQTSGRGRRGRSFYSPSATGIYMSVLIYPQSTVEEAMLLTCMMADAVSKAIDDLLNIETKIKWVNDIYYNDKKVAGILTEGFTNLEDGSLEYVVIGVGINVYMPIEGFPEEIKNIAGSLLMLENDEDFKNQLCAHIIYNFFKQYYSADKTFIDSYINKSMLAGKYVKILPYHNKKLSPGREYALVKGIDEKCRLVIEYDDGSIEKISNGEVSVVKY